MMLTLRLREIRQAKGLTIAQAAAHVGASEAHVSELERGLKRINNDWIRKFSQLYGVRPRDLFGDDLSGNLAETMLILEDLPPEDQERVQAFARALASSKQAGEQT